jgi:hypothetical protein
MCRKYLSPGRTDSTLTMPCAATTPCVAARLVVRSYRLYFGNDVRHDYSSPSSTGSTTTMSCAMTTRLPAASALHQLSRASGRAVSPLNFSSVGRTSSRRAPGHCVSRLNYSSPGCTGSTAPMPCIRKRSLTAWLLTGSTSTTSCAASTHLPSAAALHQPCRALRLLISRQHRLYLEDSMRRDYSSAWLQPLTSTSFSYKNSRERLPRHQQLVRANFSNNRRDSITDRHNFIYKSALAARSKLFI